MRAEGVGHCCMRTALTPPGTILSMQASLFKEFVELKLIRWNGETSFELQPDKFVKTWTECDLFIKRRSVP